MPSAWDMIGFDGQEGTVRVVGGRALYESVDYDDSRAGRMVRLSRLDVGALGLKQVTRYVEPDTDLELVLDAQLPSKPGPQL